MAREDFGVYIQTYPGDVHLSSILVRSIQQVSPDLPIVIIPGDDFDYEDHPFDVPIMPPPEGFWGELRHKDRSFWAFRGPFEKFLFLDADMICVKSLDGLADRTVRQEGDFLFVQPWMDDETWRSIILDPAHPKHQACRRMIPRDVGKGPLGDFDPDHDFFAHRPFNTGAFASRRGLIRESDLLALYEAEWKFYREVLRKEWSWPAKDLFFFDQGRMNYLIRKLPIPVHPLAPDLICQPGANPIRVAFEEVERDACDFHILHWMGAKSPSPSLLNAGPLFRLYALLYAAVGKTANRYVHHRYTTLSEATGYSLWRHYHDELFGTPSLASRLRWSWRDFRRLIKLIQRWSRIPKESDGRPRGRHLPR